jgi:hypothetical protein
MVKVAVWGSGVLVDSQGVIFSSSIDQDEVDSSSGHKSDLWFKLDAYM